ncbi:nucleoside hydrolase [Kineococcus sp. R8]|uniref:nucleoside hydrolase n=1 Tax=Kineococcus siccus TaxID=2696567 RepID=UPI001412D39F|nr:nucleoside hydrolase [Kineococcus siccus]
MEHVVLDTDLAMGAPGSDIDDGFALALALADPGIALDLVTTVNGNTDVETATVLTLELLHRLGHPDVPVHRGASRPLLRPQARSGSVPAGTPVRAPRDGHGAVALVDHVRAHPGEVTLVAIGPLTDVALAVRLDPGFAARLKRLVVMGGRFLGGTHDARVPGEFNVWNDPEAVHVVLTSGVRAEWVGLDVTEQVRLDLATARRMAASEEPFLAFAGRYAEAWIEHGRTEGGDGLSCALHDPLAVAAVTRPDLLTWRDAHVAVETGDTLRGVVLADFLDAPGTTLEANARVAVAVDAAGFTELFLDRLGGR